MAKRSEDIFIGLPRKLGLGTPNPTYYASVEAPLGLNVMVEPSVLSFSAINEEKSFIVKVNGPNITQVPIASASI